MITFDDFFTQLQDTRLSPYETTFREILQRLYQQKIHGDFAAWWDAYQALPDIKPSSYDLACDRIRIGNADDCSAAEKAILKQQLMVFHPWRKGPFELFDTVIDTEWRSDWKWQRIAPHLSPLKGRYVLDVGCGSGYHCLRMLGEGARFVMGIDPSQKFMMQFYALKKYLGDNLAAHLLPIKSEDLPPRLEQFDTVFSMGVLYHRRSPFEHLEELRNTLVPGGELVIETLVIDGGPNDVLVPTGRYQSMRNVWFLPSAQALEQWLQRVGFSDVRIVDINRTSQDEQRSTEWMRFQSLVDFLNPEDHNQTLEGLQAPTRATLIATKPLAPAKR